jgi:hypothetical protein
MLSNRSDFCLFGPLRDAKKQQPKCSRVMEIEVQLFSDEYSHQAPLDLLIREATKQQNRSSYEVNDKYLAWKQPASFAEKEGFFSVGSLSVFC